MENNMSNLLNNLDTEYLKYKSDRLKVYDKNYYHYQDIIINTTYSNNKFLCLKQQKIRYVIVDGLHKIKLYLKDSDIIDMIIKLPPLFFDLLIASFYKLYSNIGNNFYFSINGVQYKFLGLPFSEKEQQSFGFDLETKADFPITFGDLVILINLILAKEKAAMDLAISPSFNRLQRQLAKYISLSKFYRDGDAVVKKYLEEINYDVTKDNIYAVYFNDWKQREIDRKFNNILLFEKSLFDDKITLGNPSNA